MSLSYAASGSERPMSEGVMGSNVPDTENTNGHGQPLPIPHQNVANIASQRFLLFTFYLGLIAWLICLISQSIVAATISNTPVRILWFAIILHIILLVLVTQVVIGSPAYNAAYAYGTQISILSALATVFAVIGVDQNIYSSAPAQQATGAGWLIAAIVDLLWIIFFTSPPQSPVVRLAKAITHAEPKSHNHVEKIQRSTDAFVVSPLHDGNRTEFQGQPVRASFFNRFAGGEKPKSGLSNVVVAPETEAPETIASRSTTQNKSALLNPREESVALTELRSDGVRADTSAKPDSPSVQSDSPMWKAEAMYAYTGSESDPTELTFKKGEVLSVFDKSGKWWDAQNSEGKRGIAPSNYLRLVL